MKTAIVTGSTGNLGLAVSNKLLENGFFVAGTVTKAGDTAIPSNKNFQPFIVDLLDERAAAIAVNDIISLQQQIDVAVLTVGGFAMGSVAETDLAAIDKQIKLNFNTAYNVVKPVFEQMLKQGSGRIFLIGSRPGSDMHKSKGMVAYGLAKSLLFQLAELLNDEAKDKNVVTAVVVPSTIDTPQNRQAMPDADFSRWVKPEAIADLIYFYSTEEAAVLREPVIKIYNKA